MVIEIRKRVKEKKEFKVVKKKALQKNAESIKQNKTILYDITEYVLYRAGRKIEQKKKKRINPCPWCELQL